MASWTAVGLNIQVVMLLLDDPNEGPPTMNGVQIWKEQFGLHEAGVYADPTFSMVPGNTVGTPQTTIINPRTMVVEYLEEGWDGGTYGPLLSIAQANAAQ